jgi:cathepsin L
MGISTTILLNYAYLLVTITIGFGSENYQDYYTIKNSWGTSWGEAGYIRLAKGVQYESQGGQCGVLKSGSYPRW